MARLDSFAASPWLDGLLLTGLQAIGTVLTTSGALPEGWYLLGCISSCDLAYVYDVIQYASNGTTVKHSQRYQAAAGTDSQFFPSPVGLADGDIISIVLAVAVTPVVGLQCSLFTQQMGGRPV